MTTFHFGTKAETLERIRPVLRAGTVLDLVRFTVHDWQADRRAVLQRIRDQLEPTQLVVRSSAVGEDADNDSKAGLYTSVLGVSRDHGEDLPDAIETVIASYHGNPADQVLVQPMLADVVMSGVAMTSNLADGAPYYTINYDESGSTESVTAGDRISKTVHVHRQHGLAHVRSPRIERLIAMFRELEDICGETALDIEFGITAAGQVVLFQVRRISVRHDWSANVADDINRQLPHVRAFFDNRSQPRPGVVGATTLLGVMPDWNPAEMIGTVPGPLATSLYRDLITREVWRKSRQDMGYRPMLGQELMVVIGGRPYIDVRNSLNSFIPRSLDDLVAQRLVDAWMAYLSQRPELHDKIEFEVATTCLSFDFGREFCARYPDLLGADELAAFRESLRSLTADALDVQPTGSLGRAEIAVKELVARQHARAAAPPITGSSSARLALATALLEECRELGTFPFAVLARHAFIAETLLRSAAARGALDLERVQAFKRSIRTVTTDLSHELTAVVRGDLPADRFLDTYGHLRPGTYDIKSLRYADRDHLFDGAVATDDDEAKHPEFTLDSSEQAALGALLTEAGLGASVSQLLDYARRAIAGREWAKFVFSRNLSDALELIASWGQQHGLSRETLAYVPIGDLQRFLHAPPLEDARSFVLERAQEGVEATRKGRALKLGFLIRDVADIYVVPVHRTTPTFVGSGVVRGPVVLLGADSHNRRDLFGRIVCIERADPGFDFIFSKGIAALITKYGGSNSHMAIRCNELRVPGAIGCGEQTFRRIVNSATAEIDCDHHTLRPLHGG